MMSELIFYQIRPIRGEKNNYAVDECEWLYERRRFFTKNRTLKRFKTREEAERYKEEVEEE